MAYPPTETILHQSQLIKLDITETERIRIGNRKM